MSAAANVIKEAPKVVALGLKEYVCPCKFDPEHTSTLYLLSYL
jgi:hypothetical protein